MPAHRTTPVPRPRPSALRAAVLTALWASFAASAAMAQDPAATPEPQTPQTPPPASPPGEEDVQVLDRMVVTGIRGSIQSSISRKRDETVIADVLSADDIGDLPALSIGEAIETITGAATHREKGGASEISIRGLGPFLGAATFNGREATNGSGDRSVNFNQFPSELINTVSVYKTQRADFVEGGVAGTINMETVKPLSFGERRIQLEGRATYGDYDSKLDDGEGVGWRGTASYLDQFDLANGGRLGVSIGVQSLRGNNPEEVMSSSSTWAACDASADFVTGNCPDVDGNDVAAGTPYYLIAGSRTYRQIQEQDKRDAQFAALQWQPNDALEFNFDYQHSQRDFIEDRADLVFPDMRRGVDDVVTDDNGALIRYTGQSAIESTPDYKTRDEEYTGGGFGVIWRPSEAWTVSGDLSYSHTLRNEKDRLVRLRSDDVDINGDPVDGITGARYVDYTFDDSRGDVPGLILDPAFDLDDWDNFSDVARLRRDEQQREHEIRAGRVDVAFFPQAGFVTAVKGGVRVSNATYTDYDDRVEINISDRDAIRDANLACRQDFPQDDFLSEASGNSIDNWATFDSRCLFAALAGVDDTGPNADLRDPANNDVEETTRALYLMGEFRSELFGLPVSGNFGLRWVNTDVRSVGLRSALAVVENDDGTVELQGTGQFEPPTVIKASNDVFLPSLNAAFELGEDTLLRLGAYRAMTRPDLSDLGAGRSFAVDEEFDSLEEALDEIAATGNPRAEPLLSWNADLSLEWYPNPDSILSAAVYYKQFNGGSAATIIDEPFVIDGETRVLPVVQPVTTDEKSELFGAEFTASHRFSYLPAPFDGLGFKLSYNYADSDFKTEDLRLGERVNVETGEVTPRIVDPANIFGLSRHVASGSLYYAIGPIDLQAIYKYRSEYYQKFVGAPSQNRYIQGGSTVDFRATWRVDEHLSFSLEGSNLTDEPRISDMPVPGSFHEYHAYGRRYYLGVRYRF